MESLDPGTLEVFMTLLSLSEVDMDLVEDVYFNVYVDLSLPCKIAQPSGTCRFRLDLNDRGIITLLYYAGYLTMTVRGHLSLISTLYSLRSRLQAK